jgi:hypothetical protein
MATTAKPVTAEDRHQLFLLALEGFPKLKPYAFSETLNGKILECAESTEHRVATPNGHTYWIAIEEIDELAAVSLSYKIALMSLQSMMERDGLA